MERIIEEARDLLSEATGIVHKGKALVVACAVGAMIAGAFVVGTPNPGLASTTHSWGDCNKRGGGSYCVWMCLITGHYGGSCRGDGKCDCN